MRDVNGGGGAGNAGVSEPVSSTDNAVATYDGSSGKIIESSTATISGNNMLVTGGLTYVQPVGEMTEILQTQTVITTAQTWTKANFSSTGAGRLVLYTHTSPNQLTYIGTETKYAQIGATITLTPASNADTNWHIGIYKNGTTDINGVYTKGEGIIPGSLVSMHTITAGHDYSTSINCISPMITDDYLELAIWNDTNDINVTVEYFNLFSIHLAAPV